jgi:FAD/FMN-containing dehydrogenase
MWDSCVFLRRGPGEAVDDRDHVEAVLVGRAHRRHAGDGNLHPTIVFDAPRGILNPGKAI